MDRIAEGGTSRCLLYFGALALSIIAGGSLLMDGHGWLGLFFILGIPVFALAGFTERARQKRIRSEFADQVVGHSEVPEGDMMRSGESVDEFVERMLTDCPALDRRVAEVYAKHSPPHPGQTLSHWVTSWPPWNEKWVEQANPRYETFLETDTIVSWADRIGERLASLNGGSHLEVSEGLVTQAKYCRPRVGEKLGDFQARFKSWFAQIDRSLDLESAQSGIGENETVRSWLNRTAPLYLTVDDAECIEDIIDKLEAIASRKPPQAGEPALQWAARVKLTIDAENSS